MNNKYSVLAGFLACFCLWGCATNLKPTAWDEEIAELKAETESLNVRMNIIEEIFRRSDMQETLKILHELRHAPVVDAELIIGEKPDKQKQVAEQEIAP